MFSGEDIKGVMEEEINQKRIKEEMQVHMDDDLLYDSLSQEAHEEYCVPVRRFRGRGCGSDY